VVPLSHRAARPISGAAKRSTKSTSTHPNYAKREQVVGRGISGVSRIDLDLDRR
jgi:hypothetical protein